MASNSGRKRPAEYIARPHASPKQRPTLNNRRKGLPRPPLRIPTSGSGGPIYQMSKISPGSSLNRSGNRRLQWPQRQGHQAGTGARRAAQLWLPCVPAGTGRQLGIAMAWRCAAWPGYHDDGRTALARSSTLSHVRLIAFATAARSSRRVVSGCGTGTERGLQSRRSVLASVGESITRAVHQ